MPIVEEQETSNKTRKYSNNGATKIWATEELPNQSQKTKQQNKKSKNHPKRAEVTRAENKANTRSKKQRKKEKQKQNSKALYSQCLDSR